MTAKIVRERRSRVESTTRKKCEKNFVTLIEMEIANVELLASGWCLLQKNSIFQGFVIFILPSDFL